jgi:hypothetical protein
MHFKNLWFLEKSGRVKSNQGHVRCTLVPGEAYLYYSLILDYLAQSLASHFSRTKNPEVNELSHDKSRTP